MFSGLSFIRFGNPRQAREEFVTLSDPWIQEAFNACADPATIESVKNWSRSYYTLEGHIESLMRYQKPLLPEPQDDIWRSTKIEAFNTFNQFPKVRVMSALTDLKQVRYQEGTSAGYGYSAGLSTYPTRKGPKGEGNHKRALKIAAKIIYDIQSHLKAGDFDRFLESVPINSTQDIAFTRTQLAELPKTKIRNVFGEAFHYVLLEGLFAEPLINWFIENDTFYYIGADPTKDIPVLLSRLPQNDYKLTTDWKSFDASVQIWESNLAFDLLESMIDWPLDSDPSVTKALFKYVRTVFNSRKIQSPTGDLYLRIGGVPSGSYFTHIIDSIVNWNRMRYLLAKQHITPTTIKTHGDDGLTTTIDFPDLQQMTEDAAQHGWNLDLSSLSIEIDPSRVEFLGRSGLYGLNVREIDRSRRLMLYPEYQVTDVQISIARLKAIDQDTGSYDPLVPKMYFYLKEKYGDHGIELPREHRRFNIATHIESSI